MQGKGRQTPTQRGGSISGKANVKRRVKKILIGSRVRASTARLLATSTTITTQATKIGGRVWSAQTPEHPRHITTSPATTTNTTRPNQRHQSRTRTRRQKGERLGPRDGLTCLIVKHACRNPTPLATRI